MTEKCWKCEAGGSSREELKREPPYSPAVLWIVNVREKKKCWKAGVNNVLMSGSVYTAQLISPASEITHEKLVPHLSQLLSLFRQ